MNKVRGLDFTMAFISGAAVFLSLVMFSGRLKVAFVAMFGISFLLCAIRGLKTKRRLPAVLSATRGNSLSLLSEDGKRICNWDLSDRVSAVIGKSSSEDTADIDLSGSMFSTTIENIHAILNYAAGNWYLEDVSEHGIVSLEKEGLSYRFSKGEPCILTRGDIIRISEAKLFFD
jgi:hypothetical protein